MKPPPPRSTRRQPQAILILAIVSVLTSLPLTAWSEVRLRVGIYEDTPKVGLAPDGRPAGVFVDLIEAIAAAEGWRIEYVPGAWNEGMARLASGEVDLMPDVALDGARARLYAFHREPVLSSWSQIYAPRRSPIRALPDLRGKRVAVLDGSAQQEQLRQMAAGFDLPVQLLPFPDLPGAFRAVGEGRADAVLANRFHGARHAREFGLDDTAIIFSPTRLHYAARKDIDPAILDAIDRRLLEYKSDPRSPYHATLRRWIDETPAEPLPVWLVWLLPAGAALLVATALWSVILRREVRARTAQLDRRNAEMAILNNTLRATSSSLTRATVLEEATRGALQLTGFDGGTLCLRDAASGEISVGARLFSCNVADCAADGGPLRDTNCPAMLAELAGQDMPVLRAAGEARHPQPCANVCDAGVRWNAYFPLRVQQRTIGLLCLYSRQESRPEQRLLDLVQELCTPVALALENAQLYEQAQRHAAELEQRVEERTRQLAEAKGFLDALVDHISSPIFYKDASLRFRGCNHAYEQAFAVARDNFIGKTVLELEYLPQADRAVFQAEDAAMVAKGQTLSREAVIPFADGRDHHTLYSVSGFRAPDGSPGGLVGIIVDITHLKETETALRAAEARQREIADELNRILQYSIDAICVFDERMNFVRVSAACERLWGFRPEELIGSNYLDHIPAEEHAATLAAAQSMRTGGAPRTLEARFCRKDGSRGYVNWTAVWAPGEGYWYCIARDDSERRRLLGELQSRNAQLEASARELSQARDAAEAADRIKSAFLATMSHELRTPLNSIIGFTGIILDELAGPLNAEQKKQLTMVQNSARHLLSLINDVLDISKIEAGELSVGHQPFEPSSSIDNVIAIAGPLAEGKGLALRVDVAADIGAMIGDARRVEQILLNLLGNAIKFTDAGSVSLKAERVAGYADRSESPPAPAVRFSVRDTGIGIKPEDMTLLFQPFRQVESTIGRTHEGTGLGLAICRRLAALMGGRIEARSVWGEGSEFVVTLPLEAPLQPAAEAGR